jgi:hypothetical protein
VFENIEAVKCEVCKEFETFAKAVKGEHRTVHLVGILRLFSIPWSSAPDPLGLP